MKQNVGFLAVNSFAKQNDKNTHIRITTYSGRLLCIMTTHSKDHQDLLEIPKKGGLYDNTGMSEMWFEYDE